MNSYSLLVCVKPCSQQANWTELHQVDPVIRRVIGHARQRHEVDWLQCAHCSSVQLVCCEHGFSLTANKCSVHCSSARRYVGQLKKKREIYCIHMT